MFFEGSGETAGAKEPINNKMFRIFESNIKKYTYNVGVKQF